MTAGRGSHPRGQSSTLGADARERFQPQPLLQQRGALDAARVLVMILAGGEGAGLVR